MYGMQIEKSPKVQDGRILVTGANGFLGAKVVERLLETGFEQVRCFVRPSSDVARLTSIVDRYPDARLEFVQGNLQAARIAGGQLRVSQAWSTVRPA